MNLLKTLLPVAAVASLAIAAESCGKRAAQPDLSTIEFETRVDSVGYLVVNNNTGDSVYGAAKYSIVWPEKIGQEDFEAMRGKLMSLTFGDTKTTTVDEASQEYLESPVQIIKSSGDTAVTVTPVPYTQAYEAPENTFCMLESEVTLLNPNILVVQVYKYDYDYGEAHGEQSQHYMNYAIADHQILDSGNLFEPGNEAAILDLINAAAHEAYPDEGTLYADPITTYNEFQITENDIVFVYQQYEVAPYSTGIVKVPVSQYDLHRFLTPVAQQALGLNE